MDTLRGLIGILWGSKAYTPSFFLLLVKSFENTARTWSRSIALLVMHTSPLVIPLPGVELWHRAELSRKHLWMALCLSCDQPLGHLISLIIPCTRYFSTHGDC
ncbi:hypothetical protein V6Z11_A03G105100 [Gossypium hirsutum]